MLVYTVVLYKPDGSFKAYENATDLELEINGGQPRLRFVAPNGSGRREVILTTLPYLAIRPEVA